MQGNRVFLAGLLAGLVEGLVLALALWRTPGTVSTSDPNVVVLGTSSEVGPTPPSIILWDKSTGDVWSYAGDAILGSS